MQRSWEARILDQRAAAETMARELRLESATELLEAWLLNQMAANRVVLETSSGTAAVQNRCRERLVAFGAVLAYLHVVMQ